MGKAMPRWVQFLNARLHDEPLSSIAYSAFWIAVLTWSYPVAVVVLLVRAALRIGAWCKYDPRKVEAEARFSMGVVVTGCDTGFGREIALRSAAEGYVVFAGCLREESFDHFRLIESVRPVKMDVTVDGDVEGAAREVSKWIDGTNDDDDATAVKEGAGTSRPRVLHALICNAGVGDLRSVDLTDLSAYRRVMEVNFFGVVRCCKAFLPLLKTHGGKGGNRGARILNVTSTSGLIPASTDASAYASSKHAAQQFSRALRAEAAESGIQVGTINPSFHDTPLVSGLSDRFDAFRKGLTDAQREECGLDFRRAQQNMDLLPSIAWDAKVVVDETMKLLKSEHVPAECVVGADARFLVVFSRILPAWFYECAEATMKKMLGMK